MKFFNLILGLLLFVSSVGPQRPFSRMPASVASDPCKSAMEALLLRSDAPEGGFVDEIIDRTRLLESGRLTQSDLDEIENSVDWRDFFTAQIFSAAHEEQVMIAALLKKSEAGAPIEAVQRKYRLLFEFCGL